MKPVLKNLTYRQPGWVYSVDAHQWDFTQKNAKLGYHKDSLVHPADLSDIHLSKEGINHEHLRDTSLFNIGGYFHWHDGDATGIFIEQGAVSQTRLKTSHINIVNFEEVHGTVKLYRLEDQNILPSDVRGDLFNSVFLHVDNINFDNKLVGVVLCGELYWLNIDGKILICKDGIYMRRSGSIKIFSVMINLVLRLILMDALRQRKFVNQKRSIVCLHYHNHSLLLSNHQNHLK